MRGATEPLLVVDFQTRKLLAVSDSLTILFGSSSNNLVNSQLDSIIAVPGKDIDLGSFFETVKKRGIAKLDRVALKSDKKHSLFLEIYASMLPDENKKLVRIWVHDVTARETTIVAFQENELRRNRAEQLGKFGHWQRDMQTGKGIWSDEVYHILGLDPNEHEPSLETLYKLVEPDDLGKLKQAIENAMSGKDNGTIDVQYRINCPDGAKKVIHGFARLFEDEHTGSKNFVGILHDITERKRAEADQELLKLSKYLDSIFQNMPAGVAILEAPDFRYLRINSTLAAINGLTIEEHLGRPLAEVIPEAAPFILPELNKVLETGKASKQREFSARLPKNPLEVRHFSDAFFPIFGIDGKPRAVGVVVSDITDRKRVEEAIHYQDIVSNSRDMLALLDKNFVYLAVNESYVKAFGKTISEVVGNTVSKIRGNRQFETVIRPNAEKCLLGNEVHYENWVDFPIYGKRCMDIYYRPYYGPDKEIKGFVINGRDITERKRAEKALQESEEKFQKAFIASPDSITISRLADGRIVEVNASFERMLGYTRQEVIGKTSLELGIFKDPADREVFKNILQKESRVRDFELELCKKSGESFTCRFSAELIDLHGETYLLAISRDITESKRAEEALQKSEEKFQKAFESGPDPISISRLADGRIVEVNSSFEKVLGYTRQEVIGKTSLELGIFKDPADREVFKKILQKESRVREFELELCRKSGESFTCRFSAELIDLHGETCLLAISRDITESKRAEEALQKSEEKFEKAFISSPDAITISRLADAKFIEVNASSERMLGYTRQEVIGKTSLELGIFKNPADREVLKNILQKESRVRDMEIEFRRKSGEILTCRVSAELIDLHGETCLLAISRDITESKRAEKALTEANERFRVAFETANIAICLVDLDGRFTMVNTQACKMFGYSKEELESKTFMDVTHPEDLEVGLQVIRDTLSGKINDARFIKRYIHKDGHVIWAELSSTIVRNAQGNPLHFISYILDITERKQAEEKLKASEKSLSHAQQIAHLGSWEYNFASNEAIWSDEAYRIFEFHPDEPVLYYETYLEALHPDDRAHVDKVYNDSIRDMTSGVIEYRIVMKDGRIKYIRDRWENLNDDNGKPLRSFGTFLDITEQVQLEMAIKERKTRLRLVKDIAMEITSDMSIQEVVTDTLKSIYKMFPDYRVSYGVRVDENLYRCMASVGPSNMKNIEGSEFYTSDAPEFVKALTKGHVVTNDVLIDEMVAPLRSQLEEIQVRAMINTPVTHAVGLKGLIWLDSDISHRWTEHEIATLAVVSRYLAVAVKNAQLTEEQKKTSANLRITTERLRTEREELTHKNIALNQILEHLESEKKNFREQISESVESLLMPIVKKLKARGGNLGPKDIALLENSLKSIVGKGIDDFRKNLVKLSPRELDICELIRAGKSSKEISSVLNLSTLTIHKHRESIRGKLQLKNKSTNLSAYLRTREFLTGDTQSLRN